MQSARKIIFEILLEYFSKKKNLSSLIDISLQTNRIKPLDKKLINQISKGVVRRYITLDFLISKLSGLKAENIDIFSLIAIRIALFQILYLDRIPDYSAVNESVSIIKELKGQKSANFVNAVLRNTTRIKDIAGFLEKNIVKIKDKNKRKSIMYSFPEWLMSYWLRSYSPETLNKILESFNENPGFFFRVNTLKTSAEEIYEKISSLLAISYSIFLDGISFKIEDNFEKFMNSKFISEGLSYVQNLPSQIAINYFLRPQSGEKILDICSAPGGKCISSAIMMKNDGEIIAVEYNEKRYKILEDNLKRMSVKIVKSIKADARFKDFLKVTEENDNKNEINYSNDYHDYFDKIFIDSPCSSFGTISKNPDAKYSKNINKLSSYKQNSLQMLENAGLYLKKGGRIIFYTCTLSKVENEDVINDFIKMNKGAFVIDNTVSVKKLIKDNIKDFPELKNLSATENIIEIMPYHLNSEAASICSLVKIK